MVFVSDSRVRYDNVTGIVTMVVRAPLQDGEMTELKRIVAEAAERFPAIEVLYLFGSRACGTAGPDSDVDIAVYFAEEEYRANPLLDLELGLYLEDRLGRPVDVVVMQRVSPIMQHQVAARGRRLFERAPELRTRLELRSFKRYLDCRHYQQKRQAAGRKDHG